MLDMRFSKGKNDWYPGGSSNFFIKNGRCLLCPHPNCAKSTVFQWAQFECQSLFTPLWGAFCSFTQPKKNHCVLNPVSWVSWASGERDRRDEVFCGGGRVGISV